MPYSTPLYAWQLVNQLFLMTANPEKETWLVLSARLNAVSVRQRLLGGKNYITSLDCDPEESPFREPIHRLAHHVSTHVHSSYGAELRRGAQFNKIAVAYTLHAYPQYWQILTALYTLLNSPLSIKAEAIPHTLNPDQQEAMQQFVSFLPALAPTVVGPNTIFARRL
jgi:hypothetical protein